MCRMLGYIGPTTDLATLVVAPPHGLVDQSWQPRRQQHGTVNADGWGAGWFTSDASNPARYRSVLPIWSDPNVLSLLPSVHAEVVVAAVRGATSPSATQLTNTPPYAMGGLLLAHNGLIEGYHEGVGEELRRTLAVGRAASLEGSTDSELVLALLVERIARGAAAADAIADTIGSVLAVARARLNLIVTDGTTMWATRCGDSLWMLDRTSTMAGVIIASEPTDDALAWSEVDEDSLVTAERTGTRATSLGAAGGAS